MAKKAAQRWLRKARKKAIYLRVLCEQEVSPEEEVAAIEALFAGESENHLVHPISRHHRGGHCIYVYREDCDIEALCLWLRENGILSVL